MKNLIFLFLFSVASFAQVGIGTTAPAANAALDVRSQIDGTGSHYGFMPPRVPDDAAKLSIAPEKEDEGLLIYVESTGNLEIWNGKNWEKIRKSGNPGNASDLFISEYVCGTGAVKAVEIANFTGSSKNLSNYRLRIGDGKTATFTNINLSGTLADGSVFIVANTGSGITADLITTLSFDGDDAVILQTSGGTDIDIMGKKQLDWPFGKNIVLRKKTGYGPSLICDLNNFYFFPPSVLVGLGNHQY